VKEAVITKKDFPTLGGGQKLVSKQNYNIKFPTQQSILAEKEAEDER